MAEHKKSWTMFIGAAAGVTVASLAVVWYVRSRSDAQPIKDVQDAISKAYDKIKEIEQIATLKYAQ